MRVVEMTLESIHAAIEYPSSDMTDESMDNYIRDEMMNDMST